MSMQASAPVAAEASLQAAAEADGTSTGSPGPARVKSGTTGASSGETKSLGGPSLQEKRVRQTANLDTSK